MGLMNRNNWDYYAGPSPLAGGVDAFTQNFMKMYLGAQANSRQNEELKMQQALQQAKLEELARNQQKEAAFQSGMMNLRGTVNMPGLMQSGIVDPATQSSDPRALKQVAMGQIPQGMMNLNEPSLKDRVGLYSSIYPEKGLALEATLAGQENKQNPIIAKLMEAAQNGTINEQGKALLKKAGYDFFAPKKENWSEPYEGLVGGKTVLLRKNINNNKVELVGQDKSTVVNVKNTNNVEKKGLSKLTEEMGKRLVEERKDVEGATKAYDNIKEAEKLISSGMITGTGAEYIVNFGNFLSSRLGIELATNPVANTQAYAATMGNQVGQIIKQFGSGTGLSDADREYAEKIVGGKITLNEQALKKLMAINKKAHRNVIENFNKKAEQVMNKPDANSLLYDLRVKYNFDDDTTQGSPRFTIKKVK